VLVASQLLQPAPIADSETVYGATLVPDSKTLAPIRVIDSDSFAAPSVTADTTVLAGLITDGDIVYSATITIPGTTRTLTPSIYTDADVIYRSLADLVPPPHNTQHVRPGNVELSRLMLKLRSGVADLEPIGSGC
jgi:hypothetical protein